MCQYYCRFHRRDMCVCLALYIVFGLTIPCRVHCSAHTDAKSEPYLTALFNSLSGNQATLNKSNLTNFLKQLNIYDHHDHTSHDHGDHQHELEKCFHQSEIDIYYGQDVDVDRFSALLPIVMYRIHFGPCEHNHVEVKAASFDWTAFMSSVAAVVIISLSGLVVICMVPFMSHSFYNVVSQFLIALSVGSLIGDGLLHLIPHAISSSHHHSHDHESHHNESDEHRMVVFKALIGVFGIHLFFITERLTILCQNRKSKRKLKMHKTNGGLGALDNIEVLSEDGTNQLNEWTDQLHALSNPIVHTTTKEQGEFDVVGDTTGQTKRTLDSDDSCNKAEIAEATHLPENQFCNRAPERPMDNIRCEGHMIVVPEHQENGQVSWSCSSSQSKSQTKNEYYKLENTQPSLINPPVSSDINCDGNETKQAAYALDTDANHHQLQNKPQQEANHLHRDKPHAHHHGHSHDLSSVKAIAYTIVTGDGLHNFCDGIAIGAAFAANVHGGLSTSIAVLCHELPHELGDFAVLLRAGMSVKAALFCNLLTSLFCAAGMVIGHFLGHIQSLNSYLFMLVAGMFLYISLVDMMPELSTNQLKGNKNCHQPSVLFVWQNVGIFLGYGVMCVIAIYEHNI